MLDCLANDLPAQDCGLPAGIAKVTLASKAVSAAVELAEKRRRRPKLSTSDKAGKYILCGSFGWH